jgi:hypothetical protein
MSERGQFADGARRAERPHEVFAAHLIASPESGKAAGIRHTPIRGDGRVAVNPAESLRWRGIEVIAIMFVVYFLIGWWRRQHRKR